MSKKELSLIGYAFGLAGADTHSGDGPIALQKSPYLTQLTQHGIEPKWTAMITAKKSSKDLSEIVQDVCEQLANNVAEEVRQRKLFCVIGGDHTSAIGTWGGVYEAIHQQGNLGLIWIDAHMDSHTPETSESLRIHGMPLAVLLGHGYPHLTSILKAVPKLDFKNVCLIGVRQYERGEAEFLKRHGVRIYFMDEVKRRGFTEVLHEAKKIVLQNTIGFGISLDLDGIDPKDAPAVDVPEPDGISAKDVCDGLETIVGDPQLLGLEIAEFDPSRDIENRTEKLIAFLLEIYAKGKLHANKIGS